MIVLKEILALFRTEEVNLSVFYALSLSAEVQSNMIMAQQTSQPSQRVWKEHTSNFSLSAQVFSNRLSASRVGPGSSFCCQLRHHFLQNDKPTRLSQVPLHGSASAHHISNHSPYHSVLSGLTDLSLPVDKNKITKTAEHPTRDQGSNLVLHAD